jgi:hypothetical protein
MNRRPMLGMDHDFSRALVGAAIRSGFAKFDRDLEPRQVRAILGSAATRRLSRPALEMAVLFDKVNLFGLPGGLDLSRLENEGLLGLTMGADMVEGFEGPPPEVVAFLKKVLSDVTWRRSNMILRYLGRSPAKRRLINDLFDQVTAARLSGISFETILAFTPKLLDGDTKNFNDSELAAAGAILLPLLKMGHPAKHIGICCGEMVSSMMGFWNLICFSFGIGDPFLSHQLSCAFPPGAPQPDDRLHAYSVCKIAMTEELGYAPAVTNMDDVLRLRSDKRIDRFRHLLEDWCATLPSGDVALLKTIKTDIQKANRELRHLNSWRTVDKWLFWAQLPTALIPIVSTIVTVVSFGVQLKIKSSEKNCWVGIGR